MVKLINLFHFHRRTTAIVFSSRLPLSLRAHAAEKFNTVIHQNKTLPRLQFARKGALMSVGGFILSYHCISSTVFASQNF